MKPVDVNSSTHNNFGVENIQFLNIIYNRVYNTLSL